MTKTTRNCLDPWSFALCKSDGDVLPCCWHPPIGSLVEDTMDSIMSGELVKRLRRQLLSGELSNHCQNCPAREACTTEELTNSVDIYLSSVERPSITQGKLSV